MLNSCCCTGTNNAHGHTHPHTHTYTHTHAGSFSELVINLRHFARNSIDKFSVTRKTVNSNKNGKSQCDNLWLLNACEEVKFVSYSTHSGVVCLLRQHFANWLRRHQCVHACVISSRTRAAGDDALGNRFFFLCISISIGVRLQRFVVRTLLISGSRG